MSSDREYYFHGPLSVVLTRDSQLSLTHFTVAATGEGIPELRQVITRGLLTYKQGDAPKSVVQLLNSIT